MRKLRVRLRYFRRRLRRFTRKLRCAAKELRFELYCCLLGLWLEIRSWPSRAKSFVWNRGLKIGWYRLWIRKDEFDRSLDLDVNAIRYMGRKQRDAYLADLARRRHIAHVRDLEKMDRDFAGT